jgi:hypothetical protein
VEAASRRLFYSGFRTRRRDTFLFSVKEKYPKEIRPMPLFSFASRFLRELIEGTSCPSINAIHP